MQNQESEEGIKRRAYSLGFQLKNSNLDIDVIYARLEKQGIPPEIATQVIKDMSEEDENKLIVDAKPKFYFAFAGLIIGIIIAIISAFVFPDKIILPIGLILGGAYSSFNLYTRMKKSS